MTDSLEGMNIQVKLTDGDLIEGKVLKEAANYFILSDGSGFIDIVFRDKVSRIRMAISDAATEEEDTGYDYVNITKKKKSFAENPIGQGNQQGVFLPADLLSEGPEFKYSYPDSIDSFSVSLSQLKNESLMINRAKNEDDTGK